MKKIFIFLIFIIIAFMLGGGVVAFFLNGETPGDTRTTNDQAEKDEESRYITIINETGQTINEVHVYVGQGTEIEHAYQKNPDEQTFSIEIPEEYSEYEAFEVKLVDNYERIYEKKVEKVKKTGRTEVVMDETSYVEKKGDWKSKVHEFFNN